MRKEGGAARRRKNVVGLSAVDLGASFPGEERNHSVPLPTTLPFWGAGCTASDSCPMLFCGAGGKERLDSEQQGMEAAPGGARETCSFLLRFLVLAASSKAADEKRACSEAPPPLWFCHLPETEGRRC